MEELKETLKSQIIERLNMEDISVSDIKDDEPLFNDGLGLDSIDALEIIVLLEKEYGIVISNARESKEYFATINTLAEFISKNRKF